MFGEKSMLKMVTVVAIIAVMVGCNSQNDVSQYNEQEEYTLLTSVNVEENVDIEENNIAPNTVYQNETEIEEADSQYQYEQKEQEEQEEQEEIAEQVYIAPSPPPIVIEVSFTEYPTRRLIAGPSRTFAILDGDLWVWGNSRSTHLGDGRHNSQHVPLKIMDNVISVAVGERHTAVLKYDGSVWTWGENTFGQIGDGTVTEWTQTEFGWIPTASSQRTQPVHIMDDVVSIAAGHDSTLALKSDGSLWGWGRIMWPMPVYRSPVKLMENVASVSMGNEPAIVTKDGGLWRLEYRQTSETGNGITPIQIMDNVISATAGPTQAFAITSDGELWEWDFVRGALIYPVKIMDNVAYMSAGARHNMVILQDGSLWAWGNNDVGQLGIGEIGGALSDPTLIMHSVAYVSAGPNHTAAITKDGVIWLWGSNNHGEIGDGTMFVDRPSPIKKNPDSWGAEPRTTTRTETLTAFQNFLSDALETYSDRNPYEWTPNGIHHAMLVDFDNSGIPNLVITTLLEGEITTQLFKVLRYVGWLEAIYTSHNWGDGGDADITSIAFSENGQAFIVEMSASSGGPFSYSYLSREDGRWQHRLTISATDNWRLAQPREEQESPISNHRINGEPVTAEEFDNAAYTHLGITEIHEFNSRTAMGVAPILAELQQKLQP